MWIIFFYREKMEFEREVVDKLKKTLEVGSEEIRKLKYLIVEIHLERDRVVMSQRHYSGSMRKVSRWRFKGERELGE